MGFFRKLKVSRYTKEQIESNLIDREDEIRNAVHANLPLETFLIEWAYWRELKARKENKNSG